RRICVRRRDPAGRVLISSRNIATAISLLSARVLDCPAGSRLQQLLQLLAPEFCHAGGRVAARVFARRDQVKPAVLHALECALRDSVSGGLRSSSAELIASSAASIRSRPAEGS